MASHTRFLTVPVIEHCVGQHAFQPAVLVFERPQALGLRHVHAAVFSLPFVDAGIADAVLAAQLRHRRPGRVLLQDGNDLFFGKTATLHALVLKLGQNELQAGLSPGGNVTSAQEHRVRLFRPLELGPHARPHPRSALRGVS